MMRILQINVGVCRAAHDLALASATFWGADIVIISEQNRNGVEADGWYSDSSGRSAVVITGNLPVTRVGPMHQGFRWVEVQGYRFYSCYWTPNCNLAAYSDFLLQLERSVRTSSVPVVIAGDFNAKSRTWGNPRDDARGTLLADLVAALDATVCNDGQSPTFVRNQSKSYIDVSFVSSRILGLVKNWTVREDESLSLHRYISFEVDGQTTTTSTPSSGWVTSNIGIYRLRTALGLPENPTPAITAADPAADNLVEWLTQAADSCLTKRLRDNRRPVPWWNEEIRSLRKECLRTRRIFQRQRLRLGADCSQAHEEIWKANRKQLALAIKVAKEKCWSDLIATVDNDPWGKPYKIVTKRLRRQRPIPGIQLPGRVDSITDALFPTVPCPSRPVAIPVSEESPILFSAEELTTAARSLPNRKAPGPDGLSNEIIKAAVSANPSRFLRTFNTCLASGKFPDRWKLGKLVLLLKPGKPLDNPSAYRPICLLDGCGKLLEKMLVNRLREHLARNDGLARNQYGFRSGRSTLDALERLKAIVRSATTGHPHHHRLVGMLTLDVRNAFNTAPWDHILRAARERKVPHGVFRMLEAYLSDRSIELPGVDGREGRRRATNCGVPQGSVLGPDLWNLLYDDLARIALPDGVELIAFADDVALISTASIPFILEERLEVAYATVNRWMLDHGLSLAAEKTEAIVLTKRRVRNQMSVMCDGHRITSRASVRYLGVQVDQKMGFVEHAEVVSSRAATTARCLGHLMPNLRGPRQKTRKLLASVVTSMLLYAAPVWSESMLGRGWTKLASVHRQSQLRAACCYRTVSHEAAAVVSGIPPIHLLARERTETFRGKEKSEARRDLIANWQGEWEASSSEKWTFKLIGDLRSWLSRSFGEVCFHSTQVLTGHGCFAAYLHRFGLQATDSCEQCGFQPDDAEHGFFHCPAWENWRRSACAEIDVEELTPDNLVATMLSSPLSWNVVSKLMSRIMMTREEAERARQGQPNIINP